MKITSMTASFGKLQNAHLELGGGLNLIEAPNEGGKSTWCAFLRAMLYGIPTRERDRQGYLAEKNRYQPWSGGALEGALTLTWQGREITLRRGPKGNTPFGAFSAVDSKTGEAVPNLTAENCGETLLGVSREVYERSAFVGQGGAAIGADAELEKRIAALVSSGEEDVSYSQVEARLREWLRRRKFNKSGLIPKLENELAVLGDALGHQEQAQNMAADAQREIERLAARADKLSAALEAYKQLTNQEQHRKRRAAQTALKAAQADAEAIETAAGRMPDSETLRAAQGNLAYLKTLEAERRQAEGDVEAARAKAASADGAARDPLFSGLEPEQARGQARADLEEHGRHKKKSRGWGPVLGSGAGVALGTVLSMLLFRGEDDAMRLLIYGCAALLGALLAAIPLALMCAAHRKKAGAILDKYAALGPEDIQKKAEDYCARHTAAWAAGEAERAALRRLEDLSAKSEALWQGLLVLTHTFEPGVTDFFGVSAAISKGLSVREKLTTAGARLEGARALAESLAGAEPRDDPEGNSTASIALGEDFSPEETAAALAAVSNELARQKNTLAMARGELNSLGDPVLFQTRREQLREELSLRREEHEALTVALEALEAANADLQARFSPALNGAAGNILAALTGGKYGNVGLNRQFEAVAEEAGSPMQRQAISLSQGTAEQLYLAVRLAVCGLALPAEDPAPLVLDDALDTFDDARMTLALDYLQLAADARQILLFSCHSRERVYLEKRGGANVISLQSS